MLALTAIPNRLYNHPDWRAKYVARLKEILDAVWGTDELLAAVDEMAAVVQQHALPKEREAAAADTERVRKFILKREGEILADLTPEPPEWPEPDVYIPDSAGSGTLEVAFETTWGSNLSPDPLAAGTITSLVLNGSPVPVENAGVFAGHASPDEAGLLPDADEPASIVVASIDDDGSLSGMSLVVERDMLAQGATLVAGTGAIAGGVWSFPPGAAEPDSFSPFVEGTLRLSEAGTARDDAIVGTFSGRFGWDPAPAGEADSSTALADAGLVINEVAAKGDPLDWFELHNSSTEPIALDGFVFADDLADAGKRVAFPAGTTVDAGGYLQIELDSDGWPGFALGGDEELGIWLADGTLVARVDWEEGDSGGDQSYARVPDASGGFQTVDTPPREPPTSHEDQPMTSTDRTPTPTASTATSPLTRVDIGEVQLATRVLEGGSEVLLFIHGSFDDHHTWLPLTRALAGTGHTMVVYDRRGHSASTDVAGQGTIRQDADDAAHLIERLGLGRSHIVGHSYGAGTAVLLATKYPHLVSSLYLHEPPAFALLTGRPELDDLAGQAPGRGAGIGGPAGRGPRRGGHRLLHGADGIRSRQLDRAVRRPVPGPPWWPTPTRGWTSRGTPSGWPWTWPR